MSWCEYHHWIYRYWSGDQLLYVGYTANPEERHKQHQRTSPWYGEVTRYELIPIDYGGWNEVQRAELFYIRYGNPKYNIAKNWRGRWGHGKKAAA